MEKANDQNIEISLNGTIVNPQTGELMNPWTYSGRLFTIGYTENMSNAIKWVVSGPFMVSSETLCLGINWHDLNQLGFITGRPITLGEKHYLCRSIRTSELPWIFGKRMDDEMIWNWSRGYFWCLEDNSEIPDHVETERPVSGFIFIGKATNAKSTHFAGIGFRPVLEELSPALPPEDVKPGKAVTLYGLGGSVSGRIVEVSGYDLVLEPDTEKLPKKPWLTAQGGLVVVDRSAVLHIEESKKEEK